MHMATGMISLKYLGKEQDSKMKRVMGRRREKRRRQVQQTKKTKVLGKADKLVKRVSQKAEVQQVQN